MAGRPIKDELVRRRLCPKMKYSPVIELHQFVQTVQKEPLS